MRSIYACQFGERTLGEKVHSPNWCSGGRPRGWIGSVVAGIALTMAAEAWRTRPVFAASPRLD
jgi:hypothetical protein